jgi:hypothetical protein
MTCLNVRSRRNRRLSLFLLCAITPATTSLGVNFADVAGDNYGPTYVDITSVDVTSDATNLTFQINLNPAANLLTSDGSQIYGKYQIGFQTGESGNTAVTNPYGNPIGISGGTGVDYWIGSWADNSPTEPFGGGAQLYQYVGGTPTLIAGIGTNAPFIDVPVTLGATSTTIVIPLGSLGLAQGDTFKFDVYTTFGNPGGQSAYDALGKATQTTAPGTPYAPVTPYDSSTAGTAGASTLLSYTVGGVTTVDATWASAINGVWSLSSNWAGGIAPNGIGHTATFGGVINAAHTVTLDAPQTVGTLNFNNPNAYTLAGAAITIDGTAGGAINVIAGSHFIDSAVNLMDDTIVTVTPAGSTLAFRGSLAASGHTISKAGAGKATFANVRAAALNLQAGSVQIPAQASALAAAGTSVLNSLAITDGASLDLTNNALVIDYAAGSLGTLPADVRTLLLNNKLVATGRPASQRIGYVDNAVGTPRTTFGGVDVDASSLLIAFTVGGDANLSRAVDFADLVLLAQNYNVLANATWQIGDFNYDAKVDFADLVILAQNYNGSAIEADRLTSDFAADWALAQSMVPEPATLSIAASAVLLVRRRRHM